MKMEYQAKSSKVPQILSIFLIGDSNSAQVF